MARSRCTPALGLALAALALSACTGIREDLGLVKKAPDEFSVVRRPPLTMPPDFALRPPQPGERGPQSAEMREQARDVLLGSSADRGVSVASAPAQPTAQDGFAGSRSESGFAGSGFAVAHSAPAPSAATTRGRQSHGESALLERAGTGAAEPGIRQTVNQESAQMAANEDTLVERLMFWMDRPPPGEVVDAPRESRRLRENAALGRAPTEGRTPTIERKAQGRGISLF